SSGPEPWQVPGDRPPVRRVRVDRVPRCRVVAGRNADRTEAEVSRSWPEIAAIIEQRRAARGPLLNAMMEVRERYNGDWVLPNLGTDTKPFTPTIIADAVDHNA